MPVVMNGDRPVPGWGINVRRSASGRPIEAIGDAVRIALVNNMPDAALEDTEIQFLELLDAASGEMPVVLELYSLPHVPRMERGEQHLANFYSGIAELQDSRVDGMIITGTEPRRPNLREEPYWRAMTDLFDWAETNTISTVLSCLAAHAGVLHSDGIGRHPLSDKKLGVFPSEKVMDHRLLNNAPEGMSFPHSRWNEVRESELASAGYDVVLKSPDAGVDLFVKKKRKSLFVHFQGHPEYGARTLLKEYRRDIKRFLRGERPNYPSMPQGYFHAASAKTLEEFRAQALDNPSAELMACFPEAEIAETLQKTWHGGAVGIYRNWLSEICARKNEAPKLVAAVRTEGI
ncbi:MAG TPA: homoserine O-succinyltransferase [Verrucomicrobiae bacterium]|nr:homoserine O-succinyltransferase [Verrucomicrobiae bacterium]